MLYNIFNKLCVACIPKQYRVTSLFLLDFHLIMVCCPGTCMLDSKRIMKKVSSKILSNESFFAKDCVVCYMH